MFVKSLMTGFFSLIASLNVLGQTQTATQTTNNLNCTWQRQITPFNLVATYNSNPTSIISYFTCSPGVSTAFSAGTYKISCSLGYQKTTVCNQAPVNSISTTINTAWIKQCIIAVGLQPFKYCLLFATCQGQTGCTTGPVTTPTTCQQFTVTNTYTNSWKMLGTFSYLIVQGNSAENVTQTPPTVSCSVTGPLLN
ncbi:MAG: hypothetical protein A3F17_08020 [Gammaproteobacteria bacterium RIFCSPHIGHO2_12_FULL_41_15]|nr:MAG: hypothetical protein A3F17_08020 [Gammaproteobacteria bacterium RIFCSPHIGHO2_12_FULL_41_15]